MAEKCTALLYHCPTCKKGFKRGERVPTCPDCGADLHCTSWAVPGYKLCKNHGGPVPSRNFYGVGRGIVSGSQSQFQLTRLASKYNELQKDGRLLSNRASIGIIRDRITQLLERIDQNEAPDRLYKLQKLWGEMREAEGKGDQLEALKVKTEIDAEFEAAYHDYAAWKQMFEALDLDSKMVEREAKIAKDLHAILTAEDAYKLTAKLLGSIIAAVQQLVGVDDNIKAGLLKRIEYEFTRIIGEGSGEEPGGSGREVIDA